MFPFAGKVLVDGQPIRAKTPRQRIVVVLFDRAQPKLTIHERPYAECNERGQFSFTTYSGADGVEPADYVVAIAQLNLRSKDGSFQGPDGLKNRYNDPDRNEEISEFAINHEHRKTDYRFNLSLNAQEPVLTPGRRAVTEIPSH